MFNFKSYYDLSRDIAANITNIPEVDFVVGIPRSGVVPAVMISSFLNVPYFDLDSFTFVHAPRSGTRKVRGVKDESSKKKVLIVDDSINTGTELKRVKKRIEALSLTFEFIYCAIYANEAYSQESEADITLSIVPQPRVFQWNYRSHMVASFSCYDMDGVLCEDPTNEQNDDGEKYIDFILNAKPLFIPHKKISAIVTSRLERYRPQTEAWLKKHNVQYGELIMIDLPSAEERRRLKAHAPFKAEVYKKRDDFLFIESNWKQAQQIAQLTDKPVICTENDAFLYGSKHYGTLKQTGQLFSYENINLTEGLLVEKARLLDKLQDTIMDQTAEPSHWKRISETYKETKNKTGIELQRKDKSNRNKLRVLMLSYSFDKKKGAGAAESSLRLSRSLTKEGVEVHTMSADTFKSFASPKGTRPLGSSTIAFWNSYHNESYSKELTKAIDNIDPDLIVLGAVDRGVISLIDLATLNYPIVWIGRDNWAHTGGCLFQLHDTKVNVKDFSKSEQDFVSALGCGKYLKDCSDCPALLNKQERDIAAFQFEIKKYVYGIREDIVFAPISKWLERVYKASPLIQGHRVEQIYNPIDVSLYKPLRENKDDLRIELGLPTKKKLLLLAAHNLSNQRKGASLLFRALENNKLSDDIEFVLMGDIKPDSLPAKIRHRCHIMGFVESDDKKVQIYNSVDATIVPTLQESLSVVASDSLCCGTPVIAFATTGLQDFVEHKKNGYLAKPYMVEDLVSGINWVCIEKTKDKLQKYVRESAVKLFESEKNTVKYIELFKNVVASFKGIEINMSEMKMMRRTFDFVESRLESRHQHIRYLEKRIVSSNVEERSTTTEVSSSLSQKVYDNQAEFVTANRYLRSGKYSKAIEIYQKLYLSNPREVYKTNIEIAKKKLESAL